MTCGTRIDLGFFVAGEKPAPLEYQFLDSNGVAINLTGYTAKFVFYPKGGTSTTANAAVTDAVNGKVTYTWTGTEFATTGPQEGRFWVGNLTNRWASDLITWTVSSSHGAVPNI